MSILMDMSGMEKISDSLIVCSCSTEINPKSWSSPKLWDEKIVSIHPEGENYSIVVEKRSMDCCLCGKPIYRIRKQQPS